MYSKHLHIALAPLNVGAKRVPDGLGPLLPVTDTTGKPIDFEDAEDLDEDAALGVGKVEDFTWKGMLDFTTCTECGRCQSQCPAWNTEQAAVAQAADHGPARPRVRQGAVPAGRRRRATTAGEETRPPAEQLAGVGGSRWPRPSGPLVGDADGRRGVIDPDVLWSCTTCGACVEQCPVDIEHVDHIVDMRRYQVLIESSFPSEAGVMLRNLENKGNPWGLNDSRPRWTGPRDLDFEVTPGRAGRADPGRGRLPVLGRLRRRASRTGPRRPPGPSPSCCTRPGVELRRSSATARPAPATRPAGSATSSSSRCWRSRTSRRSTRSSATKIVATCPHCFNTLANEYPQLGGSYEVVHHTQLLGPAGRARAG